jgi:ankyrin repeat protein
MPHVASLSNLPSPMVITQDGVTPLIVAAINGHTEIVALLLEKGADKNAKSKASHCRCRLCERMWNP